jgi:hypothetical protein
MGGTWGKAYGIKCDAIYKEQFEDHLGTPIGCNGWNLGQSIWDKMWCYILGIT